MILVILLILIFGIDIATHDKLDGVSIFLIGWVIANMYGWPLYRIHRDKYKAAESRRLQMVLEQVLAKCSQ